MLCNICEDEIGLKWCSCEFKMCGSCKEKLNLKLQCGNCRRTIKKSIYFAGKISLDEQNSLDLNKRILVVDTKDKNDINEHYGEDYHGAIILSEFLDIEKELPTIDCEKHILTGPCAVIKENQMPQHGIFNGCPLLDMTTRVNILNKRNIEMIKKSEIFVLTINEDIDCFCAIKEWGIAVSFNKIMILNYDTDLSKLYEFYTFAQDSLESFEVLDVFRRDAIIKSIPNFNFNDWISYKCWLQKVINGKTEQKIFKINTTIRREHSFTFGHIG